MKHEPSSITKFRRFFRNIGYTVLSKEEPSCGWQIESRLVAGAASHPKIDRANCCSQGTYTKERCGYIVGHGLGYDSDVDPDADEAICRGVDPEVLASIPPRPANGSAAICVTVLKDCITVCHIYIVVCDCGSPAENIKCAQLVVPYIDEYIHSLGAGWLIGGALPEDYERLGEADEP